MVVTLLVVAGLTIATITLFLWASGGLKKPGITEGKIEIIQNCNEALEPNKNLKAVRSFRILTWNLSFGFGVGSASAAFQIPSRESSISKLKAIAEVLIEKKIDIALLQEVDFNSDRSSRIDQLTEVGRLSGLKYCAQALTWKANYVAYPYWPPKSHFGFIRSGGGILSRYPLSGNDVFLYPKPREYSWFYNQFYLFRFTQISSVLLPGKRGEKKIRLFNQHLEAFSKANRQEQAQVLAGLMASQRFKNDALVAGGDFNAVPSYATKKSSFADDPRVDFADDTTHSQISTLAGFRELIPEAQYRADEKSYFTK